MAKPYVLLLGACAEHGLLVRKALRGLDVDFVQMTDTDDGLVHLTRALLDSEPPEAALVLLAEPAPGVALGQLERFRGDSVARGVPVIVCNILTDCCHGEHAVHCQQADACVQTRNTECFVVRLAEAMRRLLFPDRYETLDSPPPPKP